MQLGVVLQVLLAVLWGVSGVSKLADRTGTATAAERFGVPQRIAGGVALALPAAELLAGLAVLATPALGAPLSIALLSVVSAGVVWNLAHGRRPRCACFGRLSTAPVSPSTLIRNAGLMGAAFVVSVGSPVSVATAYARLPTGQFLALMAIGAVLACSVLALETRHQQPKDGPVGAPATVPLDVALPSASGTPLTLRSLRSEDHPLLLLFLSPGCPGCEQLATVVPAWVQGLREHLAFVSVVAGDAHAAQVLLGDSIHQHHVLLDDAGALAGAFQLVAYPAGVLVSGSDDPGHVHYGPDAVRCMLAGVLHALVPSAVPADFADDEAVTAWAPTARPGVRVDGLADGGSVLVDELTGASAGLDPLGAIVWSCLDGGSSIGAVSRELAATFSAPVDVVTADVLKMTRDLARQGMLWGVPAEPAAAADAAPGDSVPAQVGT